MGYFGIPFRNGVPIGLGSVASFGAQQFDPSSLFIGGTVGTFYDPSDPTTLFTTSTGTTPCAVPGSGSQVLVGLMLDKSQGAPGALGAELVTNGGPFVNTTGWLTTSATPLSVSSGILTGSTSAATDGIIFGSWLGTPGSLAQNKYFELTVTITAITGRVRFQIFGSNVVGPWLTSPGAYTIRMYQTVANGNVGLNTDQATTVSISAFGVREIPGNHAIAFNDTTARPELSARVNLLTYSEQFDNGVWTATNSSVTSNAAIAPNGTLTAEKLVENTANSTHQVYQNYASPIANTSLTFSIFAKAAERTVVTLLEPFAAERTFNLVSGVATGSGASMRDVGDGWWQCIATGLAPDTANRSYAIRLNNGSGTTYTGDGTSGAFIWGADLRPANIGSAVPSYQRIADQYTYDSNGFPLYLRFDGVDDSMYTPASIPFATVTSDGQARRNLLSNPTQFDVSSVWAATDVTVTANATIAPDSTTTADLITTTNTPDTLQQLVSVVSGTIYTFSGYVKDSTAGSVFLVSFANTSIPYIQVDLSNGNITYFGGATTATATNVGNGWWRISLTTTANQTASVGFRFASASANAVSAYFLWGAQLETGSTATAFQNIGTDKMSVFAGVRKLSDAATSVIAELSADKNSNNGVFLLNTEAAPRWYWESKGTLIAATNSGAVTTFAAPITSVVTGIGDIGGDSSILRVNSSQLGSTASDQGTGNYGTYPLYIGSRNNSGLRFNGHLYSLIVAGAQLESGSITATEQYVAGKTGVQI